MSKTNLSNQQASPKNDYSELTTVAEALKAQQIKTLEDKIIGLSQSLDLAVRKLDEKDEEIQHLKHLLGGAVPVIGEISPFMITDEEMIAIKQLEILKNEARVRHLTLDEVRKFDILVKIKRTAQGHSPAEKKQPETKKLGAKELLALASSAIDIPRSED